MKKRIELLALSFAVTMSILVNSMTVKASQYPDVNENNWYYPYVMDVSDRGIIMVATVGIQITMNMMSVNLLNGMNF